MPEFPFSNSDRTLVLLNPRARGGGESSSLRREVAAAFADRRVPFDLVEPESGPESMRVAREAAREGFRCVAAAGGDGTVAAALRGTAGTGVPVAILPFGTGNQLAGNFGVPLDLEEAVDVAVEGEEEPLDLGRIDGEYFALVAGAGLDAEVMAEATDDLKRRFGGAAYLMAGLRAGLKNLMTPKAADFRIVADGEEIEITATMVLLANVGHIAARPFSMDIQVGPEVSYQDGLLDVAVFAPRNAPEIAEIILKLARRDYDGDDRTLYLQAREVTVEADPPMKTQIDGEPAGETPLEATAESLAGRIMVPSP
ncbi:MAG: diacylglycerol kinase family lipid kinase [Candidatus Palauibacterales bacterium]|nr:diacylglycerol kinase family lipid kinase [Candidatus Palauibacterales bacterium]